MIDEKVFVYHPPQGNQAERYEILRSSAKGFAEQIDLHCPDSVEKSVAINKLREAMMWANSSIAIREDSNALFQ